MTSEEVDLAALVDRVPEGWTAVSYRARGYGLRRTSRAGGASITIYAEELGGTDLVSANVYRTRHGDVLRPCEMPAADVLAFLAGWRARVEAPPVRAGASPAGPARRG